MKKMTCKQLGGACDKIFSGNTFKELANQSKADGKEMFDQKDAAHLVAMVYAKNARICCATIRIVNLLEIYFKKLSIAKR